MSIDAMKKATFLCPVNATQRLLKTLHGLSIIELVDVLKRFEDAKGKLERQNTSVDDCDHELQKINLILGLLDNVAPAKKRFVQGLVSVPLLVDPQELNRVKERFPLAEYYAEANNLDAESRRIGRSIADIVNRLKDLLPLAEVPFRIDNLRKCTRVSFLFGDIPLQHFEALGKEGSLPVTFAWEQVLPLKKGSADSTGKNASRDGSEKTWMLAACLNQDTMELKRNLAARGFSEIPLPHICGTIREQISALEGDLDELQKRLGTIAAAVHKIAEHKHELLLLKAFWEDSRRLTQSKENCAHGKWVQVITGYIREKDCGRLEAAINGNFSNVTICVEDLSPDECPPVSISLSPFIRPVQMLVDLFGRPAYNTFDPSPFILPTFLIFFGICFSDVAYGAMLMALSLYVMHKTKPYPGVYNFARLLFYSGIATMFFGFLLGSWFGDLYKPDYLGENNVIYRIMSATQLIDPIEKPIVVLLAALTIGMFNQFYGIGLKMYSAILRGAKAEALFDGLLWLLALPGFVLLIGNVFVPVPAPLFLLGLMLFFFGALGLILTQGRGARSLASRLLTGVISLYGIVGSYGITAFIGDTMSYCRLLALSLTTGIVALSFNMMADLLRPVPYVGFFLFVFVLIIAHIFNFLISVLGAFVHSMRLIFVEFFGRFYATGSKPFEPLGFDSQAAVLRKR